MIARITVLFSCVNMHCTLILPLFTGSLNWYMHVVGKCEAKCCGVTWTGEAGGLEAVHLVIPSLLEVHVQCIM